LEPAWWLGSLPTDASIASMIERDSQDPDGDYLFTLSEEIQEGNLASGLNAA
jgi:hypothetical protein